MPSTPVGLPVQQATSSDEALWTEEYTTSVGPLLAEIVGLIDAKGNRVNPVGGPPIDTGNSTTTPLANGSSFNGAYNQFPSQGNLLLFAVSDQPLSTLEVTWSPDGVTPRTGLIGVQDITSTLFEVQGYFVYLSVMTTAVDNYYKLTASNTSGHAQTLFELDVWQYTNTAYTGSFGPLNAPLTSLSSALLTRTVLAAQSPQSAGFVAATSADGNATSLTVNVPAGSVAGTVMTAAVFVSAQVTVTAPAGWVPVLSPNGALQGGEVLAVFTRVAGVSEPASYTFSFSGGVAVKASGAIITASNVSNVSVVASSSGQVNSSSTAIAAPSATFTAGCLGIGLFGITNTSAITVPTGWTQATQDNTNTSFATAYYSFPNIGSTGTVTATAGAARANIGALIVLNPATTEFGNLQTDVTGNLRVADDYQDFQAQTITLVANTSTQVAFAQPCRMIRVKNFDTVNKVLIKSKGGITGPTDATADLIGQAPVAGTPAEDYYPIKTQSVYLLSAGNSQVTVVGFF